MKRGYVYCEELIDTKKVGLKEGCKPHGGDQVCPTTVVPFFGRNTMVMTLRRHNVLTITMALRLRKNSVLPNNMQLSAQVIIVFRAFS